MDKDSNINQLLLRNAVFLNPRTRIPQASMSPPGGGDVAQTPDTKSSNAFANVFKSLTGNKLSKSPHPYSPISIAPQLNGASNPQTTIYGGPPNYEDLYQKLKAGNNIADRIAAADSLRLAVQDYPLSGVSNTRKCVGVVAEGNLGYQHF